jgi:hypothetical protein
MHDTFYFSVRVVRARSGQEEYTETIHLSEYIKIYIKYVLKTTQYGKKLKQ